MNNIEYIIRYKTRQTCILDTNNTTDRIYPYTDNGFFSIRLKEQYIFDDVNNNKKRHNRIQ